jgi:hypothetical protein
MVTLVAFLVICVLIGIALYSSVRGPGATVTERDLGGINTYEAYYGKNRWQYGGGAPCDKCERTGCIGAGECRCTCHPRKGKK